MHIHKLFSAGWFSTNCHRTLLDTLLQGASSTLQGYSLLQSLQNQYLLVTISLRPDHFTPLIPVQWIVESGNTVFCFAFSFFVEPREDNPSTMMGYSVIVRFNKGKNSHCLQKHLSFSYLCSSGLLWKLIVHMGSRCHEDHSASQSLLRAAVQM